MHRKGASLTGVIKWGRPVAPILRSPPFYNVVIEAMLRIVAMLRLALVMTALLSAAAALPLVRGGEDLLEAGVHRKELPHRVEESRAGAVPPELVVSSE